MVSRWVETGERGGENGRFEVLGVDGRENKN